MQHVRHIALLRTAAAITFLIAIAGCEGFWVEEGEELVGITVQPAAQTVLPGATLQFRATGLFGDGTSQDMTNSVSWSSSSTALVTISGSGLATAASTGSTSTVTISAASGNASGSTQLTVNFSALQTLDITPPDPTIAVGGTLQFTATGAFEGGSTGNLTSSASWSSSLANIATVRQSGADAGFASGVAAGTTTITATVGSITDQTTLTVQ
jgi:hypothetical protein